MTHFKNVILKEKRYMLEQKTAIKKKNERNEFTFPKSNILSLSRSDFNLDESRIFSILFWQIGQSEEWQEYYDIDVAELIEMLGMEYGQHLYSELMKIGESIVSKTMSIHLDGDWDVINIVKRASYRKGRGKLRLYVDEDVHQFLKNLLGNYTIYDLRNFLALKTYNAFRAYDILRTQAFNKKKTETEASYVISLDDFKALMNMSDKYLLYGDFKKRVLEPLKKQISKKTDISLRYLEIKTGRKVTHLDFRIQTQKPKRELEEKKKIEEKTQSNLIQTRQATFARLQSYDISEQKIVSFLEDYDDTYINENLDYVDTRRKLGKVEKPSKYAIAAIQKDYAKEDRADKQEKEVRKAKRQLQEKEQQEQSEIRSQQRDIYFRLVYDHTRGYITEEEVKLFLEEKSDNAFIQKMVEKENLKVEQYESSPYTRQAFAYHLAVKYLDKKWHSFEAWEASQDT